MILNQLNSAVQFIEVWSFPSYTRDVDKLVITSNLIILKNWSNPGSGFLEALSILSRIIYVFTFNVKDWVTKLTTWFITKAFIWKVLSLKTLLSQNELLVCLFSMYIWIVWSTLDFSDSRWFSLRYDTHTSRLRNTWSLWFLIILKLIFLGIIPERIGGSSLVIFKVGLSVLASKLLFHGLMLALRYVIMLAQTIKYIRPY